MKFGYASGSLPATPSERNTMSQTEFPVGWDEERVRTVLNHNEEQTEDEATAEDETAFEDRNQTFVEIPNDLLPEVRSLIAKHQTRA
jgi:hypothetical protein